MMQTTYPAGLFSRAGVRYEVALDVLGSLIAHYAEVVCPYRLNFDQVYRLNFDQA